MAIVQVSPGQRIFNASLDVETDPSDAFALLCAVEKWPVWLPFLQSAKRVDPSTPLALGSEVLVRSSIPGEDEELYEVDQYIANFHLSLVGAYSMRRRLDFRVERKTSRSKLHLRVAYPAYHGRIGVFFDRLKHARRFNSALDEALVHFKGLAEYGDAVVAEV